VARSPDEARGADIREGICACRFARAGYALVALALLAATGAFALTTRTYTPDAAIGVANSFIDRINAGDLKGAYDLTGGDAAVGASFAEFDARLRHQLAIDILPLHRPATFVGLRSGRQSYGNRLRRWITGRKVDPDVVGVDYSLGVPFEVRLASDERGNWRVIFFQSHAA
jgi:hypothetical protein